MMMSKIPGGTCSAGATDMAWNRPITAESLSSVSAPNLNDGYAAPGPKFSVTNGAITSWVIAASISAVTACLLLRKNADWSWDRARDPRPRDASDDRPMNPARTLDVCQVSRKLRAELNWSAPLPLDSMISNALSPGSPVRSKPTMPEARMEATSSARSLAWSWDWP